MFKHIYQINKRLSPFFLFPFTLLLTLLLCLPWVSAKEQPKPKPEAWQINGIVAALDDSYPEVKKLALEKLGQYQLQDWKSLVNKPENIAKKLFDILKDKTVGTEIRNITAYTLGTLGEASKPYIKEILYFLKDKTVDTEVRTSAAQVLGNLGETAQPYTKDILNILEDKTIDSNVRVSVAYSLGRLGEVAKPYAKDILNILKDKTENSSVRGSAVDSLGRLGEVAKPYVKDIVGILKDKTDDSNVRASAAKALGNLGEVAQPYAKDILDILKDKTIDSNIRRSAAEALGNLGEATNPYAQDIINILKDKTIDFSVRRSVIETVGNLGDAAQPHIKDILDILKDKNYDLYARGRLAEALAKLGKVTELYIKDIIGIIKDENVDSSVRSRMAETLGNLPEVAKPNVKDILDIIKDKNIDFSVRLGAVNALGKLGDSTKPYFKDILGILKDKTFDSNTRGQQINFRDNVADELRNLGEAAKPYTQEILEMIEDKNIDPNILTKMLEAFGYWRETAKPYTKNIADILKDKTVEPTVRSSAAVALIQLGDTGKPYIQNILDFIQDKNVNIDSRIQVVQALGNRGEASKPYVKDIIDLLKDKNVNSVFDLSLSDVSFPVVEALGKIDKLNLNNVFVILDNVYYVDQSQFGKWRFFTYFLSGGTDEVKTLLTWLGRPKTIPEKITEAEAVKTLKVFLKAWEPSQDLTRLREDLAKQIAVVARKVTWQPQDIVILETHYNNLKKAGYSEADSLQSVIINLKGWQWFFNARTTILIHAAFWLALIFAYPKFPQVQAIFFWNPWVRRILGVGYVGFLLTWFPPFRQKLFEPFQPSLLADAGLDNFNPQAYFPESKVKLPHTEEPVAITQVLPNIKGQIVLEGDSGLGKSMFLRHLVKTSPRLVVYLPARKCDNGVIEAIQAKLHGQAQDADFLKNLIYSGALDICIDGLNEVTADTRAKITQFVESYFRGNIIMTTQPLEWTPPSTAKIYKLQALEQDQILQFLISCQPRLPKDAKVKGKEYEQASTDYLTKALSQQQSPEELAAHQRILSNPMDLTVVALMLAQGEYPDLFHLQQQQYNLMAREYLQEWKQEFPLKKFSQAIYEMRLNDEQALPGEEFYQALQSLEDENYKMVVSRQWQNEEGAAKKEWYFRHDKIMEFFLVQNFLGENAAAEKRLIDHMGDPRFRGVYFLLATLLPFDAAKELREKIIQYAADTKDHTVSDTFVQLLRSRS